MCGRFTLHAPPETLREHFEVDEVPMGAVSYYMRMKDAGVFALAGLWEHWEQAGEVIESCTLIVTAANDTVRPVHDRMPVIIKPPDYAQWLDPERQDAAAARGFYTPGR